MGGGQGSSQKGVQPSYGRPFLDEIQGKFTYPLISLWDNMPSGRPVFNACQKPGDGPEQGFGTVSQADLL